MRPHIHQFKDRAALDQGVAQAIVAAAQQSVGERGAFAIALSGGQTPRAIYMLLAQPPWREQIQWDRVQIVFGDERAVAATDPQSNFRMANEALLSRVPLPECNIHRMAADAVDREGSAQRYAQMLRQTLPTAAGLPQIDLVLLGMGTDGHVASLFPDTSALAEHQLPVVPVFVPRLGVWRMTLTFPVINNALRVFVIAAGAEKADLLAEVFAPQAEPSSKYPVQRVQPVAGVDWYVDAAAAARIPLEIGQDKS
jgi:6-phosphogluconolactonase